MTYFICYKIHLLTCLRVCLLTENFPNGDQHEERPMFDDTPSPGIKANAYNPFSTMIDLGLSDKPFEGDSPASCGGNNPFSSPGVQAFGGFGEVVNPCLLYTSPSPRDATLSRMPTSA